MKNKVTSGRCPRCNKPVAAITANPKWLYPPKVIRTHVSNRKVCPGSGQIAK